MITMGFGLLAARGRQQGALAHRRHRRPAGCQDVADPRPLRVRPHRLHRLRLLPGRAVRRVPGRAAAHPFALRPLPARHPRELDAHAGHRRAEPVAPAQGLHHLRRHRGHRRRPAGADHRDGLAPGAELRALGRYRGHAGAGRHRPALRRAWSAPSSSWWRATSSPASTRSCGTSGSACCWSPSSCCCPTACSAGWRSSAPALPGQAAVTTLATPMAAQTLLRRPPSSRRRSPPTASTRASARWWWPATSASPCRRARATP